MTEILELNLQNFIRSFNTLSEEATIGIGNSSVLGREGAFAVFLCASNVHKISRMHAQITRRGDKCYLLDCGSAYGTFVNSRQIEPYKERELRIGDILHFGCRRAQGYTFRKNFTNKHISFTWESIELQPSNIKELNPIALQQVLNDLEEGDVIAFGSNTSLAKNYKQFFCGGRNEADLGRLSCELACDQNRFYLRSRQPLSEILVNDQPLEGECELQSGDKLRFTAGGNTYTFNRTALVS